MPRSFRSLKKGAIRADWHKHTLYNLSRLGYEREKKATFFQQKWKAKSLLRQYHHPDVREKRWERMFDRRLPAVVSMSPEYLARSDGRELSAGRGSGLIIEEGGRIVHQTQGVGVDPRKRTPYMQMTFFPLEKRLDTAIFRAMFASSVRQARSMILHGGVTVNGRKMIHPGYLLNPGDLFQVEPDRVMYATGAPKRGARTKSQPPESAEVEEKENEISNADKEGEVETEQTVESGNVSAELVKTTSVRPREQKKGLEMTPLRKQLVALQHIVSHILDKGKGGGLFSYKASDIRKLQQSIDDALEELNEATDPADKTVTTTVGELTDELGRLSQDLPAVFLPPGSKTLLRPRSASASPGLNQDAVDQLIQSVLDKEKENPYDPSKPYKTPWQPRKYMSAFAFIPRYLEVNQNICAAVYLRHPVARPGLAEVPSPFHPNTAQLAFNWYLRRR